MDNVQNAHGKSMSGFGSLMNGFKGSVYSYPTKVEQQHNIYITGPIREVEEHQDRIELIRTAPPGDTIRLIINTPGGHVDTMISYIQAIKESKARVICHAEGSVMSAGTFIWLSGHEHTVADYTAFMFHNMQYGVGGDAANIERAVLFNSTWGKEMMKDVYGGFLTEEELTIIASAGEVYLTWKEVKERMPAYYQLRQENNTESCDCEECRAVAEIEAKGYFTVNLDTGKPVDVFADGSISEDLLDLLNVAEWRELAQKLGVEIKQKDSKKVIRNKIITALKEEEKE